MFSNDILQTIVIHTNEEIERQRLRLRENNFVLQTYHVPTDEIEIKAFIGLLYYTAALKQNNVSTRDMWSEMYGCGIFRCVMNEQRFKFLLSTLRFDDKTTRAARRATDKLAPIRDIWEILLSNCVKYYEPSNDCTIDEQLVAFRGRCPFKIYMKSKPDRYGMKIIMLNDSRTFYMMSGIVYTGKVTPEVGDDVPSYFVQKLVNSTEINNTWRTLTMDNWFVSVPLFKKLKNDYQLRAVGTIRKNRRNVPANLKPKAEEGSSRFVFTRELTLVSFAPKKNKIVLLSSLHHTKAINPTTKKPEIIMSYNENKGGTDAFDQKCHTYTTARGTRRWPLKFFFNMLDQAGINAFILYTLNANNERFSRCNFLKQLGFGLVKAQLRRRLQSRSLRTDLRKKVQKLLEVDEVPLANITVIREETRAKCKLCESQQATRTRMKCASCFCRMCDEHRAGLCVNCVNEIN